MSSTDRPQPQSPAVAAQRELIADAPPCDGSYCCPCPAHAAERAEAVARGVRRRKRQPWETGARRRTAGPRHPVPPANERPR